MLTQYVITRSLEALRAPTSRLRPLGPALGSSALGSSAYCVDEDDDDSGGRTQRDCLSLAAPDRKVSSSRPSFFAPKIITKIGGCRAKICNGYDPGVVVSA